jgi:hypothetical protein
MNRQDEIESYRQNEDHWLCVIEFVAILSRAVRSYREPVCRMPIRSRMQLWRKFD